jgi:predicted kinase
LIVGGLSGSGKSTVAKTIAEAFGAELLSTDLIRRSQLGESQSPANYGEGYYWPELRSQIYNALETQADSLLCDKLSVILDGTFVARHHRRQVYDLAARHGAVCLFVLCRCDRNTALSRIKERSRIGASESEARAEFYDQQLQEFEPPRADEATVMVDTTQGMPQQLNAVYTVLRQMLFGLAEST